jgi:hypothetical protein
MKIFIGGSRAVSKLSPVICARLDDFVRRGDGVLIGDANGADKAVQQYLAGRHYPNVEMFCMEECRNNIGSWPIRKIVPPNDRKDFSYYAAKDMAMAQEAGCGMMLWDGKSKGTLQNILNLMAAEKRTLVYFTPSKDFHVLSTNGDLQALIARCDRKNIDAASRALGVKFSQPSLPLAHP